MTPRDPFAGGVLATSEGRTNDGKSAHVHTDGRSYVRPYTYVRDGRRKDSAPPTPCALCLRLGIDPRTHPRDRYLHPDRKATP